MLRGINNFYRLIIHHWVTLLVVTIMSVSAVTFLILEKVNPLKDTILYQNSLLVNQQKIIDNQQRVIDGQFEILNNQSKIFNKYENLLQLLERLNHSISQNNDNKK